MSVNISTGFKCVLVESLIVKNALTFFGSKQRISILCNGERTMVTKMDDL